MSIKWIKITTTMFDDEKIKLIRQLPESDSILLTWIQLLVQAGKANASGSIILNERIPYTEEMLATIFDRPINIIRLALNTFEQFGMINIENGVITISNWEKHQNIDAMEKVRERERLKKQRQRERLKEQQTLPPGLFENVPGTEGGHVPQCPATDIDIEIDKEKDIIPHSEIIDYLNQKAGTSYKSSTKKTQDLIRARWKEGFRLDDFKKVIDKKVDEWLKDEQMCKYLRPDTLFGTKFEGYLNAPVKPKPKGPSTKPDDDDFLKKYGYRK